MGVLHSVNKNYLQNCIFISLSPPFMPKGVRAPDQRSVTVSIPKWLVDEIDRLAAAESRSRSNWIVKELTALIARKTTREMAILPKVAEESGRYGSLPLVETDIAGRVTRINAAFTRMCGYTLRQLRGKKPGEVLQSKETEPDIVEEFRAAIKDIRPYECTMTNKDARGHAYRVHIKMNPLFDEDGNLTGFRAVERKL